MLIACTFFVLDTTTSSAQALKASWTWLTPQPTGESLVSTAGLADGSVLACTETGLLVRGTGNLDTWEMVPAGFSFSKLAVGDGSRCWAITNNGTVLYSDDKGSSWMQATSVSPTDAPCIAASNAMVVVGGSDNVLTYSTDGGVSWKDVASLGLGVANSVGVKGSHFFGQSIQGVVVEYSSDGQLVKTYPSPFNGAFQSFTVSPDGTLLMGTEDKGIFRWSATDLFWRFASLPTTRPVAALFAKSADTVVAACSMGMTIMSTDSGRSFFISDTAFAPLTVRAFSATPHSIVGVGTDGHITILPGGSAVWMLPMQRGLSLITAIHKTATGTVIAGDDKGRIVRRQSGTTSWTEVAVPSPAYVNCLTSSGAGPILMSTKNANGNGLLRSTDDGTSWETVVSADLVGMPAFEDVQTSSTSTFFGRLQGKLMRTTDAGTSWSVIPFVFSGSQLTLGRHLRVVSDAVVWCTAYEDGNIYRTTDVGATWSRVDHGGLGVPAFLLATSADQVATGSSVSFNVSTDGGATWERTPETATPNDVGATSTGGTYAVYSESSVYLHRSTDALWTKVPVPVQDLPQRLVRDKAVCWLDDNTLLVSAKFGGIMQATLSVVSSVPSQPLAESQALTLRGITGAGSLDTYSPGHTATRVVLYDLLGNNVGSASVSFEGTRPILSTINTNIPAGYYIFAEHQSCWFDGSTPVTGRIVVW